MNHNYPMPQFARSRNPELDFTHLRVNLHSFTANMLEAELHSRLRYADPRTSRNQIITEVLDDWANRCWNESKMKVGLVPENPFEVVQVRLRPGKDIETDYVEVRASVRTFTLDVIEAYVRNLNESVDPDASRGAVIRQILNCWAVEQWHRSSITMARVPSNPFSAASAPQGEEGGNV